MGAMASQIISLTIVYSTVYSSADQRKHQSSASLAFVREIHRWQIANNAENVSMWWRHHGLVIIYWRKWKHAITHYRTRIGLMPVASLRSWSVFGILSHVHSAAYLFWNMSIRGEICDILVLIQHAILLEVDNTLDYNRSEYCTSFAVSTEIEKRMTQNSH